MRGECGVVSVLVGLLKNESHYHRGRVAPVNQTPKSNMSSHLNDPIPSSL
jgi:hypothetical protein